MIKKLFSGQINSITVAALLVALSSLVRRGINSIMGPLKGFKIIEIASIGPGQFAGMMLFEQHIFKKCLTMTK